MIKEGVMVFVWRWLIVFREFPEEQSAFIMGFYDQFIGSINNLVFGKMRQKKTGIPISVQTGDRMADRNGNGSPRTFFPV